jgi:hypothetical protein
VTVKTFGAASLSFPPPRANPSRFETVLTTTGRAEVIGYTILAIMFPTPSTAAGADRTGVKTEVSTGLTLLMTLFTIAETDGATAGLALLTTPFMTAATEVTAGNTVAVTSLTALGMRSWTSVIGAKTDEITGLTLLRTPLMTAGMDVTAGRTEPAIAVTLLEGLDVRPWTGVTTGGSEPAVELTLPRALFITPWTLVTIGRAESIIAVASLTMLVTSPWTGGITLKSEFGAELTLLRMLDTTRRRDVTTGKAEPVTELRPPATLETRPWIDDPTDGSRDIPEMALLRTPSWRLATGITLGTLILEIVLLAGLDKRPWTEVPLEGTTVKRELRLVRALDRIARLEDPLVEPAPVAEAVPVARFPTTSAVAEPTWLVILLLRPPVFKEGCGSIGRVKTDPAELGTTPNAVKSGDATGRRLGVDVAREGTQSCRRFASEPLGQIMADLHVTRWLAN